MRYLTGYPAATSWIRRCVPVGLEGASLEGGEDTQWIQVVAPLGDFAVLDDDHGDVSVAIGVTGGDDPALGGLFEHHRRR
jgi:hypothetical protein